MLAAVGETGSVLQRGGEEDFSVLCLADLYFFRTLCEGTRFGSSFTTLSFEALLGSTSLVP